MLKVDFRAMGCQMAAFLDREDVTAAQALQLVPGWFEEWEQALSRFRPDSELNLLNASAGRDFQASPVLWEVLQAAMAAAAWTEGLVVPTLLAELERAGYDRSFDQIQARPAAQTALVEVLSWPVEWRDIRLNPVERRVFLPAGSRLDLGGIAKGWAAQQAVSRLSSLGPALMDAGGDIAVSAAAPGVGEGTLGDLPSLGNRWPIEIADPLSGPDGLGILAVQDCGVATSGIDYRRWQQAGRQMHHLIDPRTGEPADTDLLSVTVIAPDVLKAEAAAKTIMILGSQPGLDWLSQHPELSALLVFPDGCMRYGNDFLSYYRS